MGFVQPIWVVLTWSGFVILKKITLICQLFYFMLIKIGQFGNFQPIRNLKIKNKKLTLYCGVPMPIYIPMLQY